MEYRLKQQQQQHIPMLFDTSYLSRDWVHSLINVCKMHDLRKFICQKKEDPCMYFNPSGCPVHAYERMGVFLEASLETAFANIHVGDVVSYVLNHVEYFAVVTPMTDGSKKYRSKGLKLLHIFAIAKKQLCPCYFQ